LCQKTYKLPVLRSLYHANRPPTTPPTGSPYPDVEGQLYRSAFLEPARLVRSVALKVAASMNIVQMNGAQSTDNESGPNVVKKPDKPLRFVTNYGAPHPKRRRIGAACLTCRKRKTACSGKDGSR
jgi:hypothetical protein